LKAPVPAADVARHVAQTATKTNSGSRSPVSQEWSAKRLILLSFPGLPAPLSCRLNGDIPRFRFWRFSAPGRRPRVSERTSSDRIYRKQEEAGQVGGRCLAHCSQPDVAGRVEDVKVSARTKMAVRVSQVETNAVVLT